MKRFLIVSTLALTLGSAAAQAKPAAAYVGQNLAKTAKITLAQATKSALTARPGKITDTELEKEAGGSGLRYSFDITQAGVAYEVGIDAQTGKVLENAAEGKNPD
ncbi:MAG: PepSY domain-containing protein [Phenylobacterium sp.]|uniref:PepSY domain-containing protein n=1 Tax=Phenylobacterium sp. TaxID=1871053 RepID=UPI003BB4FBF1